ncbi:MAG: LysR family transcriptional regulator [Hyphomicrobiales bacterium]|nr:LysR family transcriptional regulator [Hyphomicrobiales bacterium]
MNIKQLRAFREVMLTGSVSEAARNLYRTQPAISSLISGLEGELGCEMFVRRGGRLHPVPEAHYLFEEASTILSRLDSTQRNIKNLRDLESGSLRIVAMPGPSAFLLPQLISQFVDGRDGIKVQLVTRSSPQVHQLMASQYYDLGLADQEMSGGVESALIEHHSFPCNCLCAVPKNSPLASKETISAADLDGIPLAVLQPDHVTRVTLKESFQRKRAALNIRFETQYFVPLFTFVENGQACSIVDPLSAKSYQLYRENGGKIAFRRFVPNFSLSVSLITPKQRTLSNLARAFSTTLANKIDKISQGQDSIINGCG